MGLTATYIDKTQRDREERLGEERYMHNGLLAKIIRYANYYDIDVQFEDGVIVQHRMYGHFKTGSIGHPNKKVGVSVNELVCLYYFQQIGFSKAPKGSLNHVGLYSKELDLYNPNFFGFRIGIEYDGYIRNGQGHTKEKDLDKNKLCHDNNILLYRIREPHLPALDSTSKDFTLDNSYVKSKSFENTLKDIIVDLEKISNQTIEIDVDFNRDEIAIHNFIKDNYQSKYREERIGEIQTMKGGFDVEIIDYIDGHHIVVKFLIDGTIINADYSNFRQRTLQHPNRHQYSQYLGETKIMSCGLEATVTEYFGCRNCTVTFSDGTIVKNVNHANFRKGQVGHPNINPGSHTLKKQKGTSSQEEIYIGMERIMSNGQKAKLTKYKNDTHVSVEFEDGTVVEDTRLRNFLRGYVQNPNYDQYACRYNETKIMNCGMSATITDYINANDITVRFDDGTILEHQRYQNFEAGTVSHPILGSNIHTAQKSEEMQNRVGETRMMKCGMNATITSHPTSKNLTIQFEDGTIVEGKSYYNFQTGSIGHPNIQKNTYAKHNKKSA